MPRLLLLICLAALALPAAASARPRVALSECVSAVAQAQRSAGFEARMNGRADQRLQMRFTLQSREPGRLRWRRLAAPGWAQWQTADPGITRYAYEKRVENLAAPAQYRAVVRFRWLSPLGKTLRVARAVSPACRQRDPRPDLRPLSIAPADGHYVVAIRNFGRGSAEAFSVLLAVNGSEQPTVQVGALAPRSRTEVAVPGPRCLPGSRLTVTVDSEMVVDERDELDNVLSVPCPTPSP
jgi:hypothetical protein